MSRRKRSPAELRRDAEERVHRAPPPAPTRRPTRTWLLHELEVHRVELEVQDEELRAASDELEAGQGRYTALFDAAPIGYFTLGADGTIQDANLPAARLLGTERDRLRGRRFAALVSPSDAAAFERFERALASGGDDPGDACELELVREPRDGTVHVRLMGSALTGPARSTLVAAEDVTARKRAEDALRVESRRRDDFLSALSHELRNPLAPIRNGLALLTRSPAGGEQARRALAIIERQVGHLSRIVDDLLDVTRLARGQVRLRRERVELGDLVRRALEDHRATFESGGIALDSRLPRTRCWVDVDATRLAQVLDNLLTNAAKFTAAGGRVDVTVEREGDLAALRVRDTGIGLERELRDRLFQPFSQGPQPLARTRGGLGLGLATVKGLVQLHGGTVDVHSEGPGRGAEFTVRLPLAEAPARARAEAAPEQPRRCRVLVIDDNEDGASTLRELLELSGHDACVALDGPSGLALARALQPEIVLCDIGLPGMDGYDVARALRADERTRHAYLVALSGYALPEDLRRAREAGFDRHVAKPPMLETLLRIFDERTTSQRRAEDRPDA